MLGNSGDELTNMWGLIATGITVGGIGFTLSHRISRLAFFTLGGLFLISGIAWAPIRQVLPSLAHVLTGITSNPSNWFLVFMFAVGAVWLRQYRKELLSPSQDSGDEFSESTTDLRQYVESRFTGITNGMEELSRSINTLRSDIPPRPKADPFLRSVDADLQKLLNVAGALCMICECEGMLAIAPPLPEVLSEKDAKRAKDFITICEARFITLQRYKVFKNIMKNGEQHADEYLEKSAPVEFKEASDKLAFRKRQVVREQSVFIVSYFKSIKSDSEQFLRENVQILEQKITEGAKRLA